MAWRAAYSLDTLLNQVNAAWPKRSKASDGTIGDPAHSARVSDHNPNAAGVVCARDFTHDPVNGPDARKLAEALVRSRDPRLKYVISNGEICSGAAGPLPWTWRKYTGSNAHRKHVHISVSATAALYDDRRPWSIDVAAAAVSSPAIGSALWLQRQLNKHGAGLVEDGAEGAQTIAATRAYAVEQLKGKANV